ncbi:unnamed protein product, partial [Porites evermanni]
LRKTPNLFVEVAPGYKFARANSFKTNVSTKTYERHSKTTFQENGGSEYAQQKPRSKACKTNDANRAAIMSWEMILNDWLWFTNQMTPAYRNTVLFIIDLKTERLDCIR